MSREYPAVKKIEAIFNMSFEDVITKLHWKEKRSIKSLSTFCKVSRDTFQKACKRLELPLRTLKEATKLTPNKGPKHFRYGKPNIEASERMTRNNPMRNNDNLIKASASNAITWRNNPLPQEALFKTILQNLNVSFIDQHAINRYVVDFFIPHNNLCVEIDSTDKWGKERRKRATTKDNFLSSLGFTVLRISRNDLKKELYIRDILQAYHVI